MCVTSPRQRFLPQNDPLVTYPLQSDIVPAWGLFVGAFICAPIVLILSEWMFCLSLSEQQLESESPVAVRRGIILVAGIVEAGALSVGFTDIIKSTVGAYRPDYLAMSSSSHDRQGRLSFPSGHTSLAFASAVVLFMYFLWQFYLHRVSTGARGTFSASPSRKTLWLLDELAFSFKFFFSLWPLIAASLVATTRLIDYHHHFWDVIAGALLGSFFGGFVFLRSVVCYSSDFPISLGHPENNASFQTDELQSTTEIRLPV